MILRTHGFICRAGKSDHFLIFTESGKLSCKAGRVLKIRNLKKEDLILSEGFFKIYMPEDGSKAIYSELLNLEIISEDIRHAVTLNPLFRKIIRYIIELTTSMSVIKSGDGIYCFFKDLKCLSEKILTGEIRFNDAMLISIYLSIIEYFFGIYEGYLERLELCEHLKSEDFSDGKVKLGYVVRKDNLIRCIECRDLLDIASKSEESIIKTLRIDREMAFLIRELECHSECKTLTETLITVENLLITGESRNKRWYETYDRMKVLQEIMRFIFTDCVLVPVISNSRIIRLFNIRDRVFIEAIEDLLKE